MSFDKIILAKINQNNFYQPLKTILSPVVITILKLFTSYPLPISGERPLAPTQSVHYPLFVAYFICAFGNGHNAVFRRTTNRGVDKI